MKKAINITVALLVLSLFLSGCAGSTVKTPDIELTPDSVSSSVKEKPTESAEEIGTSSFLVGDTPESTDESDSTSTEKKASSPKEPSAPEPATTESQVQSDSSVSKAQEPSQAEPETTVSPPSESFSEVPTEPNATAADTTAGSAKVLGYLNQYRTEQGTGAATELPGLAEYARYRSRQLVSNFAHDTDDERAAATALQYGKLIDPSLYEMEGDPYYTACAREAIAKAGYAGSVDSVAEKLAQLVRNSSGHWAYVGSGQYGYIAVGVTYESGMWYCDIAMAMENYG